MPPPLGVVVPVKEVVVAVVGALVNLDSDLKGGDMGIRVLGCCPGESSLHKLALESALWLAWEID